MTDLFRLVEEITKLNIIKGAFSVPYKKDAEFTEEDANELYECAQLSAALDLRMEAVKKKVMPENKPKK